MISAGFFWEARIGDRVILGSEEGIVVEVVSKGDSIRFYLPGFGETAVASPSPTSDGIAVECGWGDGWAIMKADEQIDRHAVWKFYARGSDQEGDSE